MGDNITVVRQGWRDVKSTYAKILKEKKVSFDKGLGKQLDQVTGTSEKSHKAATEAIKICDIYLNRIGVLPPTEKEAIKKKLEGLKKYLISMNNM